jgi:hypothetical protein
MAAHAGEKAQKRGDDPRHDRVAGVGRRTT